MSHAFGKSAKLIKKGILSSMVVCGGGVIGIWCYTKNTLFLNNYKKYIELKSDDGPVEPSLRLMDMVSDVQEDIKDFVSEYTSIDSILVPGVKTLHLGTLGTYQGGIVGLPSFFEFSTKNELKNKLLLDQSPDSEEDIYDVFLLSDEAKKYAIAREILLINTPQVYADMVLPLVVPYIILKLTSHAAVQSELSKLPLVARAVFYLAITIIGLAIWRTLHNRLKLRYERKAEVKICKLSESYLMGGLEYNTKALKLQSSSVLIKDQENRLLKVVSEKLQSMLFVKELPIVYKIKLYENVLQSKKSEMK